jgi:2-iminobutanoate/2-iminopropanoate deaminase
VKMNSEMETVIPDARQRGALLRRIRDDAKKWSIGIVAILALAACSAEQSPRAYDRDPALPADLPFSSAVIVGDTIYLSGEIGRAPGGTALVDGGVGAETRQIFENYKQTLARVGADLSDIVKCTVFLDDMSKFAQMNAAYAEALPDPKPARSTFGVDGLALGAALEIECLAVKK